MQALRLLAVLLDYPTQALVDARADMIALIPQLNLAREQADALAAFIAQRCHADLYDWQAEYDSLFERGRSLSLLLFEHVHGESRDRGQAMVDLLTQYEAAGLALSARELPDYIPLYLEFLSTQGEDNARDGLREVAHILAVLQCRLEARGSNYAALFHALLGLSGAALDLADVKAQLADETRDDTPQALDKVWEEEVVSFTANPDAVACPTAVHRPAPAQRRDQEQILHVNPSVVAAQA